MHDGGRSTGEAGLGRRLFTFAVVADSHLNEAEDHCSSPFEVNRKANGRLRHVVDRLEQQAPAFVIHLGDLVHPVPALRSYAEAAAAFREQIAHSSYRWHLVPGNHDVGDKPLRWAPAAVVKDEYLALWQTHFGEHYYTFDHAGCRFVVINASILNSGLDAESAQAVWLEALLARSQDRRLVLCTHYPPYLNRADELEHYDNIAEPARSWLLELLARFGVEILLAGHVHNFWYYRHADTDCYVLPSTAFVRQDYSEMYRVPPGPEGGRDDRAKLGYFMVSVHEGGMVCHMQRTDGRMRAPGEPVEPLPPTPAALHPLENPRAPLGFELRSAWAEETEIPPSGAVDEFVRKRVRNDYPLLALWEMGVRRHLIPVQDLLDERLRTRMRMMCRMGHRFVLQSFAAPDAAALDAVTAHRDLVEGWVIAVAPHDVQGGLAVVDDVLASVPVPVFLSRLLDRADIRHAGDKYYHVIAHGFAPQDGEVIDGWRRALARPVAGAVFRILGDEDPATAVHRAAATGWTRGLETLLYMRQAHSFNPAAVSDDERRSANRLAGALFAAVSEPGVTVYSDTFADVERSYFRRAGVVDRRFNPKPASRIVRHLYAALNADPVPLHACLPASAGAEVDVLACCGEGVHFVLLLPRSDTSVAARACSALDPPAAARLRAVDLESGAITTLDWSRDPAGGQGGIRLATPLHCAWPTLLVLDV